MKKREFSEVMALSRVAEKIEGTTLRNLCDIISNAFSAVGTISPEQALSVLDQLADSREELISLARTREEQIDELTASINDAMPDTLVFEESYDN